MITRDSSTCQKGSTVRRDSSELALFPRYGSRARALVVSLVRRSEGQDLIEYALLTGFLSLIAVAAITAVGEGVDTTYANIAAAVNGIGGGSGGSGGGP